MDMIIKFILTSVARILGLEGEDELTNLLVYLNLAVANIASNHRELLHEQEFITTDGIIPLSKFEKPFLYAKSVRQNGINVTSELSTKVLNVPRGRVVVTYAYVPILESMDTNPFDLPDVALEYGTLTEYAFAMGMFTEGKVWNAKLGDMLFSAKSGRGRVVKVPRSF